MGCLAVLAGSLSCNGTEPAPWDPSGYDLIIETDHLRIWSGEAITVCEGSVRELEGQIEVGAGVLGIPLEDFETIDVLLTSDQAVVEQEGCWDSYPGCYNIARDVVFAMPHVLRHELNHGVMEQRATPSSFLNEGFAEALSNESPSTLDIDVIDQIMSGDREYKNSRTVVQWLLSNHGHEAFRRLLDGQDGIYQPRNHRPERIIETSLEAAYGWNAADLIDAMAATMPERYLVPFGLYCSADEVTPQPGPLIRWGFEAELDCDSDHTRSLWPYYDPYEEPNKGPDAHESLNTMTRRYTLEFPTAGVYRIATDAPLAVVRPCVRPMNDDPTSASPTRWGPEYYAPLGEDLIQFYHNHTEFTVPEPGTVTLEVGGPADGPSNYLVSLILVEASLGLLPQ